MDDLVLSAGLGASIGLLYGAASLATIRLAARRGDRQFMLLFLGGMIARLAVAVVLVMLVVAIFEVHVPAFIGTLFFVFLLGLSVEVWLVHRRRLAGRQPSRSAQDASA